MGGFFEHNAITAKIRCLYGKRITKLQYSELLRKVTVNEIAAYLKNTSAYCDCLSSLESSLVHRSQLESILRRNFFEEQVSILKFSQNADSIFLKNIILRFEIEQILNYFNFLKAGRTNEFIYSVPSYIVSYSKLNLTGISGATSYSEFKSLMVDSAFRSIFKNYDPDVDDGNRLLETLLYSYYYSSLFKNINLFSGNMKSLLKTSIGSRIDILNISHIIRLKKYYKADYAEIEKHIIPFYQKITKAQIDEMIKSSDDEEAYKLISKTNYSKLFSQNSFPYIEGYLHKFTYDVCKKIITSGKSSIAIPFAYFNLKDTEVKNLVSIIEGVRYSIPSDQIKSHLIGV